MTDALKKLIEAVEAGHSPMWTQVTGAIGLHPDNRHLRFYEAYKGSLDAAKALHEALLPGRAAKVWMNGSAEVLHPEKHSFDKSSAVKNNPGRAWLICILKAKLAEDSQ